MFGYEYQYDAICPCQVRESRDRFRQTANEYNRRTCGVPEFLLGRTFGDFQVWGDEESQRQLSEASYYMAQFITGQAPKPWVLLLGPPGVGKTHLLVAATMALVGQGVNAIYVKATDLARSLRNMEHDTITRYKYAKCLALDDMLSEYQTEWSVQGFEELLFYRYEEQASTLISTNADLSGFSVRLLDRAMEIAEPLLFDRVASYRRR